MKNSIFIAFGLLVLAGFASFQWASFQQKTPQLPNASAATQDKVLILGTATKTFNITAQQWQFTPSTITVDEGDSVTLNVTSTDVTHGFSIPDFGVSETLSPGQTTTVTFTANKDGSFSFSCSVSCGSGHSGMRGTLVVNAVVQPEAEPAEPPEELDEPEEESNTEGTESETEVAAPQESTPVKKNQGDEIPSEDQPVTTTPVPADDPEDAQEDVLSPTTDGEPLPSDTETAEEVEVTKSQTADSETSTTSSVAPEPPTLDLVKVGATSYTVSSGTHVPEVQSASSETQSSTSVNANAVTDTLTFQRGEPITFSGKTLPNATVTLEIRSDPITATTQSDSAGKWEYTLDEPLETGEHTITVAVTDTSGKTSQSSDPIAFLLEEDLTTSEPVADSVISTAVIIAIGLGVGFLIIFLSLFVKLKRSP